MKASEWVRTNYDFNMPWVTLVVDARDIIAHEIREILTLEENIPENIALTLQKVIDRVRPELKGGSIISIRQSLHPPGLQIIYIHSSLQPPGEFDPKQDGQPWGGKWIPLIPSFSEPTKPIPEIR